MCSKKEMHTRLSHALTVFTCAVIGVHSLQLIWELYLVSYKTRPCITWTVKETVCRYPTDIWRSVEEHMKR